MSATALRLQPTTVPPGPSGPRRPQLRVLEGGRAPGQVAQRAIYRRRRLVVLAMVLALVVVFTLLATAAVARFAGGAPSAAGGPSNGGVAAAPTLVVQPGDTLWSIAADVAPDADVRITVDQLIALNGSTPIVPGQELILPG
jgi:LysM domain